MRTETNCPNSADLLHSDVRRWHATAVSEASMLCAMLLISASLFQPVSAAVAIGANESAVVRTSAAILASCSIILSPGTTCRRMTHIAFMRWLLERIAAGCRAVALQPRTGPEGVRGLGATY